MAYNVNNEKQTIIATFDKNKRGDKIRVTKIEKEKSEDVYVDIRTMFTDEDGTIKPTQKGIRIHSEMAVDILKAILEALGEDIKQDLLLELNNIED